MTKLGLGCAQLGMPYGNSDRLMPEDEAIDILKAAYAGGIRFFDTARAYGESEYRLLTARLPPDVTICSKVRYKIDKPYYGFDIFLFHVEQEIEDRDMSFMTDLVEHGAEVGVSCYTRAHAEFALRHSFIKWLQVPVNLLDRRFVEPAFVAKCKAKGVRLIARSILLQGVLVGDGEPLPKVKKAPLLAELRKLLPGESFTEAFNYIFGTLRDVLDVGLIGVQNLGELEQAIHLAKEDYEPELEAYDEALAFATEHNLTDPRTWNDA